MDWFDKDWSSLQELISHIARSTGLDAVETPDHLSNLAAKVRSQLPVQNRSLLELIPVGLLPEARFNAYAISTDEGPAVAIDHLIATVLPAFTAITWGLSFEDPEDPLDFDPRQLIWLACAVHMGDIRPILQFPCWAIVFDAFRGNRPGFALALKMIDVELAWILGHEYGHIVSKHLEVEPLPNHEFEADRIATDVCWKVFRPFEHFVWALENVFLLFAVLEQFEPTDDLHPPASDRAEAMRQQLLLFPDGGAFWPLAMKRIREQCKLMTSFNAETIRQHWIQSSNAGANWWQV
jgi:hypothetical protein